MRGGVDGTSVLRGLSAAGSLHFHFLRVPYTLASYPGPEGGGKRAWYLLHVMRQLPQENLGCHERLYAILPSSHA